MILSSLLLYVSVGAQGTSTCTLTPNKVAAPYDVVLGETVRVTLTLEASCPSESNPVDVVLVVDESASMQDDGKLANAKAAALAFVQEMDMSLSRVGLVTFTNGTGALRAPLSHDPVPLERALENLLPGGLTNISFAIQLATEELNRDPQGARRAMVVLTDGRQTQPGAEPIDVAADRAKQSGITIATFCAGDDCDPELRVAASSPDMHFEVPDPSQLPVLYRALAGTLVTNGIATLTIRDEIPANMRYVPGSAVPEPETVSPTELVWRFNGLPPAEGITYLLEPLAVGVHPTNIVAIGEIVDQHGKPGNTVFPIPEVRVTDPDCIRQPIEVFFLIDDSNCLYGQMLNDTDALSAIRMGVERVLDEIDLGIDTAAVIGFGDRAIRFQTLTHDRQLILDGVQRVTMRDGSARLDRAFEEVVKELESGRHDPRAQIVTITVTDGPMMQIPELAELRGIALREQYGARHYSVGVGFVSQHSILRSLSEPGGYYEIPFGGDVVTPMGQIGATVAGARAGCPPSGGTPTPTEPAVPAPAWYLPRNLNRR